MDLEYEAWVLAHFFSRNYPRIFVFEMGADKPDDIKNTATWVKPDVVVLTALAEVPAHVENFGRQKRCTEKKGDFWKLWAKKGSYFERG